MIPTPPLLPGETFARVLRIARFDGLSVLGFAGFYALLAAAAGDIRGAIVGVVIAGGGAIELHGVALLRHGTARGVDWLVASQIFLLIALLGYCAFRLTHLEMEPLRAAFQSALQSPLMQKLWAANQEAGRTEEEFLRQVYSTTYVCLAIAAVAYQGGMTAYYLRRREPVTRALAGE